jgi:hypothetical protein
MNQPKPKACLQLRAEPPLERRELSPEDWKKFARTWPAFMKAAREHNLKFLKILKK